MKIVVTGAKGFLGWHLRCRLAALTDHEVVAVGARSAGTSSMPARSTPARPSIAIGRAPLPLAVQEAALRTALPDAAPVLVRLPHSVDEASIWKVRRADGSVRDVFLDPYTGQIAGIADPDLQPMNIVRRIHGTLLGGEVGSHIVELVACWTLVMLATGIWLWWPRYWKLRGVLVPRLSATGRRFWRDLHAIPGIVNALLVALLVASGLPWSAFRGVQFARLGELMPFVAPSPNFKAPPPAPGAAAATNPHALHDMAVMAAPQDDKLPWTMRHTPVPAGGGATQIGIADIERLLPMLDRARFGEGVRISYPKGAQGVFGISYVPDQAEGQRTIYVDPASGLILGNTGWADYSPVAKAVEWGVMTHMGRQYGLANQLANLLVCLVLVAGVVAGIVLWWCRRPKGNLAAPAQHVGDRLPPTVAGMIAVMAVLFPLVGASLLLVLGAEFIARNRPRRRA